MGIIRFIEAIKPEIYWFGAVFMFFYASWLVTGGPNRDSWNKAHPLRKILFYPSLLMTCFSWGTLGSNIFAQFNTKANITLVATAHVFTSGTASVFVTELFRVVKFFGTQWTDRKHLRILIITWIVIFIIAMGGVILARRLSYRSVILG